MAKKKSVAKSATKKKSVDKSAIKPLARSREIKVKETTPEVKEADLSRKKLPRKERIALMQKLRRG